MRMRSGPIHDPERRLLQLKYLEGYIREHTITAGCEAAGIAYGTYANWRDNDPDFRSRYEEAKQRLMDVVYTEVWRRAISGVDEPVYQQGQLVGQVRKYSDLLLLKLAQAQIPAFRDKRPEDDGGPERSYADQLADQITELAERVRSAQVGGTAITVEYLELPAAPEDGQQVEQVDPNA